jgi:hypothetical protein
MELIDPERCTPIAQTVSEVLVVPKWWQVSWLVYLGLDGMSS